MTSGKAVVRWHRVDVGSRGQWLRRRPAASRVLVRQPPSHSHEIARAQRYRRVAAARRLNQGKVVWPKNAGARLTMAHALLDALVLGPPWQHIGEAGAITVF